MSGPSRGLLVSAIPGCLLILTPRPNPKPKSNPGRHTHASSLVAAHFCFLLFDLEGLLNGLCGLHVFLNALICHADDLIAARMPFKP